MRLIDADALKEKKVYSHERHEYIVPVCEIDWLPTVEERPHGEWVLDQEFSFVFNMYECSKCRFNGSKRWHFCPNCGSDNRKSGEAE